MTSHFLSQRRALSMKYQSLRVLDKVFDFFDTFNILTALRRPTESLDVTSQISN